MYRYIISGVVQGVGFRPYIYRKAKALGLIGYVKNIGGSVEVVVNDNDFISKLNDLPPLAKITNYSVEKYPVQNFSDFKIIESSVSTSDAMLPPDIMMCDDCKAELAEKNNRRHNYYFITCTNCGPRFSMITDYPYDRPFTSMNEFPMCDECKKEYTDPINRRYHAQTIACKNCGPKLFLLSNNKKLESGREFADIELIKKAAEMLKNGEVIAIKGIGGFHLCSNVDSVKKIRKILGRLDKPFALMVKNIEAAEKIAVINQYEKKLLLGPERPIVVLQKLDKSDYSDVSELDSIGIMLPYTPLHHLLFSFLNEPLVMTSCNIPGEPIITEEKLATNFLSHDRKIINRCDDSVIKIISSKTFFLRRSRGFVPLPITLPINTTETLALGAELNNVVSVTRGDKCYLSQYIGETSKFETFNYFKETVNNLIKFTRAKPKIIACDLHPAYNSTIYARELLKIHDARLIQIQHHKAHVASVAAEHGFTDYVGIAMDGLGYGEDGNIWGGEVFDVKNGVEFTRIGHLEEQPQIGGDSATIYPKKMLFGILSKVVSEKKLMELNLFQENESRVYFKQLRQNFNISYTTSAGRVLDAASALLCFCDERTYDGRPAMLLESNASTPINLSLKYILPTKKETNCKVLSTSYLFFELLKMLNENNVKKEDVAATAQFYIANGLLKIAEEKEKPIVFSGGVAYNKMISEHMIKNKVLVNKEIPCGDGGICYGQVYLANLLNMQNK